MTSKYSAAFLVLLISCFLLASAQYNQDHTKIKVYRGPTHGHRENQFAPWGYYSTMPGESHQKGWRETTIPPQQYQHQKHQHNTGQYYHH